MSDSKITSSHIPQQRSDEVPAKRVITTFIVTYTLNESLIRHNWRGKTEAEILESIESEPLDEQAQEFVDEFTSMALDDPRLLFVRHVKIVDPE